ncbi:MAG: hypothetical protein J0I77_17710 [Rudaea sp.]|uniref:recombination protein NinB n=1 Tax=unclassified Rudaea TaxID=2627037 RepID=UPI0010F99B97|nr:MULTISPECIES: recombination protein NinB [unclassified Rudaea]MBN8887565.1 hypothetical protein [Rudaea sp.]
MTAERTDWQETGRDRMTRDQQKLLNAACGDLAEAIRFWHGARFDKDDFRHLIAACVLGERIVPGVNTGHGNPGLIRMSRSSLEFTRSQATEAIRMAFDIGDNPGDQGLSSKPVRWGATVCLARFVADERDAA